VTGGAGAESDEEYLVRVLTRLRNPVRYGKEGDFAARAYKHFGVFGAAFVPMINDTNGELVNFYEVLKRGFSALRSGIEVRPRSRRQLRQAEAVYANPV
jgi:uncharacterized phage protein gp47/JayE